MKRNIPLTPEASDIPSKCFTIRIKSCSLGDTREITWAFRGEDAITRYIARADERAFALDFPPAERIVQLDMHYRAQIMCEMSQILESDYSWAD